MTFYLHDGDGRILQTATVSDEPGYRDLLDGLAQTYVEDSRHDLDPWTHCVIDGAVTPKTPLPGVLTKTHVLADGADTASIVDLPAGTAVTVDGTVHGVTSGAPLDLTFAVAGVYRIGLDHPRHSFREVSVEAVAD